MHADWLRSVSGAICNAGQRSCELTHFLRARDFLRSGGNLTVYVFCDHSVKKDYYFSLFVFGNEGHIHSRLRRTTCTFLHLVFPSLSPLILGFYNCTRLRVLTPEVGDPLSAQWLTISIRVLSFATTRPSVCWCLSSRPPPLNRERPRT